MTLRHLPTFESRIIPVVEIRDRAHAVPMARALFEGGIDVIEVTLRSDAALHAIEAIARWLPQMVVGAGTVTRQAQVAQVLAAGARFGLSPGATPPLLEAVLAQDLPFIPGVATPSEAMVVRDAGFSLAKCFPAARLGGVNTLKAWAGPLPEMRFCPTGGISTANLTHYLALPQVPVVGGSWLTPAAVVEAGNWDRVRELARAACTLAGSAAPAAKT